MATFPHLQRRSQWNPATCWNPATLMWHSKVEQPIDLEQWQGMDVIRRNALKGYARSSPRHWQGIGMTREVIYTESCYESGLPHTPGVVVISSQACSEIPNSAKVPSHVASLHEAPSADMNAEQHFGLIMTTVRGHPWVSCVWEECSQPLNGRASCSFSLLGIQPICWLRMGFNLDGDPDTMHIIEGKGYRHIEVTNVYASLSEPVAKKLAEFIGHLCGQLVDERPDKLLRPKGVDERPDNSTADDPGPPGGTPLAAPHAHSGKVSDGSGKERALKKQKKNDNFFEVLRQHGKVSMASSSKLFDVCLLKKGSPQAQGTQEKAGLAPVAVLTKTQTGKPKTHVAVLTKTPVNVVAAPSCVAHAKLLPGPEAAQGVKKAADGCARVQLKPGPGHQQCANPLSEAPQESKIDDALVVNDSTSSDDDSGGGAGHPALGFFMESQCVQSVVCVMAHLPPYEDWGVTHGCYPPWGNIPCVWNMVGAHFPPGSHSPQGEPTLIWQGQCSN